MSDIGPTTTTLPSAMRGDAVADRVQAVEIVRHHEHGKAQRALQRLDQRVEFAAGDRVEAGCRLVEEQDFRIERQRARERDALGHAAGKLRRKLVAVIRD